MTRYDVNKREVTREVTVDGGGAMHNCDDLSRIARLLSALKTIEAMSWFRGIGYVRKIARETIAELDKE